MSSSDSTTTYPVSLPNIFLTTPSDNGTETNFAQTKEPFDITSYSEFDESEDDIEIDSTRNNLSDTTDNNFQEQEQESVQPATSPQTLTPSEFSDPTTDELLQYASDIALFAVNPDSPQERFLTTPNQEMEDLERLRVVISRKSVFVTASRDRIESSTGVQVRDFTTGMLHLKTAIVVAPHDRIISSTGVHVRDFAAQVPTSIVVARGPLAGMGLKIEDLPEWVISPVVELEVFGPIQRLRPGDGPQSLTPLQHQNNTPVLRTPLPSAVVPRCPLVGMGLSVEDLPEWAISPVVEQDAFKPVDGIQPVDGFQSVDKFQPVNEIQLPNELQSLASPQHHTKASSLGSISDTPLITKSSPLNLLNRAMYKNCLNIIHGEEPEWDISSSAAEELFQLSPNEEPLPIEEEQNNDTLIPPAAPILGNLSTPDLSEMDLYLDLRNDIRSLFQVLPRHPKQLESSLKSLKREEMNEQFIIGEVSENSRSLINSSFVTPPRPISEQLEPRVFRLPPRSVGASPHTSPEIPQQNNINTNIDVWPTIALALGIPILPSRLLTPSSLQTLGTMSKLAELEEGYLSDELHQWALQQHLIFVWINSGALDDGIDGIVEEPVIFPQGKGSNEDCDGENSENSVLWDYEDVEAFARSEPVHFRRNLEWIQGVDVEEEEKGSVCTLPDKVYDFCGDEEIIHRSVSEPVEESEGSSVISEEYDEEKKYVGGESKLSSSSNQIVIRRIRESLIFWARENMNDWCWS
ncbi:hypothetical protein EAF04_009341 [Stromatinia cepivora]|nr:hypothetical protein EAF04_009341 [Stromatinia cepivora]